MVTHPYLVAQQEDVILDCIDSPDITIRIQALDLVQGMVTGDILMSVVSRLMKQLKAAVSHDGAEIENAQADTNADSDSDSQAAAIAAKSKAKKDAAPLPEDYRIDVIGRILSMSSKNNYASIVDFDWYIDVLTQLVRMTPAPKPGDSHTNKGRSTASISERVGDELRNVAVKVKAMRASTVRAAENILLQLNTDTPAGHQIKSEALKSVVWMLGEYSDTLTTSEATLNGLIQLISRTAKPEVLSIVIHAVVKVFSTLAGSESDGWPAARKAQMSLLLARILHSMEPLVLHPNLEVQERAVEIVELLKLTAEAASSQPSSTDEAPHDPPLLLTQAIPSLFNAGELNSVAVGAQFNVPVPDGLDLDEPIHPNLNNLLAQADNVALGSNEQDDFEIYYHQRPAPTSISSSAPAISRLAEPDEDYASSYQQPTEDSYLDADIIARRKAERQERNKDDPFYIGNENVPQTSSSIHNILQNSNGPDLDIDSIPIMQLDLDRMGTSTPPAPKPQPKPRQKVVIASDETLQGADGSPARTYDSENNSDSFTKTKAKKLKQSLLQVDSSTIGSFNLEGEPSGGGFDHERQQREDAEMQHAMQEVERLRLEMQRANERIQVAQGVDAEGAVVKKKKKKKVAAKKDEDGGEGNDDGTIREPGVEVVKKKKKKTKKPDTAEQGDAAEAVEVVPKKKKKKTQLPAEPAQEEKDEQVA